MVSTVLIQARFVLNFSTRIDVLKLGKAEDPEKGGFEPVFLPDHQGHQVRVSRLLLQQNMGSFWTLGEETRI